MRFLPRSQRLLAIVDSQSCTTCGGCIGSCPFGYLRVEQQQAPGGLATIRVDEKKCVGCRLCESACPNGAITVQRRDQPRARVAPPVAA